MKCDVIRDLLPLYEEGLCRGETKKAIDEHLKTCQECRELRELMVDEIEGIDDQQPNLSNDEFMQRYYQSLIKSMILKGIVIYILVVIFSILIK